MSTINDTDSFEVQRGTNSYKQSAVDLMSTIQDTDLMLIQRGTESFQVDCLTVKDQLGGGGAKPPSVNGAVLTGTGAGFSGQTYTTSLTNYDPGNPPATQTMKARVVGSLQVVGETSAITNVDPKIYGSDYSGAMSASGGTPGSRGFETSFDGTTGLGYTQQGGEILWDASNFGISSTGEQLKVFGATSATVKYSWLLDNGGYTSEETFNNTSPDWDTVQGGNGGIVYPSETWGPFLGIKFRSTASDKDIRLDYFMVGNTILKDGEPVASDETILTLTDRKDLDNGLFQPGDTVIGYDTGGVVNPVVFAPNPGGTDAGQLDPNNAQYAGKAFDGGTGSFGRMAAANLLTPMSYSTSVEVMPAGNIAGCRINAGRPDEVSKDFQGEVNGIWQTIVEGSGTIHSFNANLTNGATFIYAWRVDGTIVIANGVEEVKVVSIDQSSPEMSVSGGDWTIGETVKNTVARAPEITPTTDEITGFSQVDSWNMAQIWRSNLTSSTGGFQSAAGNAFDGNVSNRASTNSSGTDVKLTFAPDPGISFTSKLEVYCDQGSDVPTAEWNGNVVNPGGGQWVTVYEGSGTIDDTKPLVIDTKDAVQLATLNAVRVDGQILVDSDFGTPSPKNTVLTFASDKDLPNFDGGDEVAQDSGYTPITSVITDVAAITKSDVGIYASADLNTAPTFRSYLDKGDTTTPWNTTWDSVTYVQTGGTGGTIGFWYSDDAVNWTRDSSTNWGTSPLGGGGTGVNAKRYMAFNADVTGVADGTDVGYVDIPDMTGLTVVAPSAFNLTLTDDKDLENLRVGDRVTSSNAPTFTNPAITANSVSSTPTAEEYVAAHNANPNNAGGVFIGMTATNDFITISVPDGGTLTLTGGRTGSPDVVISCTGTFTSGPSSLTFTSAISSGEWVFDEAGTLTLTTTLDSQGIYFVPGSTTWNASTFAYGFLEGVPIAAIGPGNTLTVDGGTWANGETVVGPATTPATGTVASTDPAAKTMTLSASDESGTKRWIVNADKTVVGPKGPANKTTAYLTWNGTAVTGLQVDDPGYAAPPPGLQLTFTDPAPTGQTWDQELPAGTSIATRVVATNDSGSADTGWTPAVTPRFLREGDEFGVAFAEQMLLQATFENRAAVHQGELAMQEREQLKRQLAAAGVDPPAINKLLGGISK